MISIDATRCNGCGACSEICHEYCIAVGEKPVRIDFRVCSAILGETDAATWYAIYNTNLYAKTRDVACCNLVGNQMIFYRSKALRRSRGGLYRIFPC